MVTRRLGEGSEGTEDKDEGRRTKDEGRGTKDEGRRTLQETPARPFSPCDDFAARPPPLSDRRAVRSAPVRADRALLRPDHRPDPRHARNGGGHPTRLCPPCRSSRRHRRAQRAHLGAVAVPAAAHGLYGADGGGGGSRWPSAASSWSASRQARPSTRRTSPVVLLCLRRQARSGCRPASGETPLSSASCSRASPGGSIRGRRGADVTIAFLPAYAGLVVAPLAVAR